MSVYAMADLHLDIKSNEKSMEIFGNRWQNYVTKIKNNWCRLITENDTVIIPGDISWALNLNDSIYDLQWIHKLPGKKIFLKGNHDFWWATQSKMNRFLEENNLDSISILNNNAYCVEDVIVCGSRGWFTDKSMQNAAQNVDYSKIINREIIRLRMSLTEAKKLQSDSEKEIIVFLHFPPVWSDFRCDEILALLNEYNIKRCYFGHIHSNYTASSSFCDGDISFKLISADFLDFIPQFIA